MIKGDGQPDQAEDSTQSDYGIKPPRNSTKALVTKIMRNGRSVIVKDFSRCSAVIKFTIINPSGVAPASSLYVINPSK